MTKRLLCTFAILVVAGFGLAGLAGEEGNWEGWITDTSCGAKGTNSEHAACAKRCVGRGENYALYTTDKGKLYVVEPQEKAAEFAGKEVKVAGVLEGNTIKITSIGVVAVED